MLKIFENKMEVRRLTSPWSPPEENEFLAAALPLLSPGLTDAALTGAEKVPHSTDPQSVSEHELPSK